MILKKWLLPIALLLCLNANGQDPEYARNVISDLASPAFHGRGYVEKGDSLASEYIKREFEQTGLLPVKGSYFQSFHHNVNVFPGKLSLGINGSILKPGVQYLADPASAPGIGDYKTELLSYGDILSHNWLNKIKKSKKKVLLVDLRGHNALSASEKKILKEFEEYLRYEDDIAAKAIAFLHDGKIPWYVSPVQALRPSFFIFADSLNTQDTVVANVSFEVEAQWVENYTSRNVIGYLPGTSGNDSCIVISAHYDHLGRMGKDTYFPGANDNASGVALMLDLAKQLKETPPEYDTYFIAFAGEEAGLLGSRHFTEHPLFPLQDVKFLLNLDLAGTGVDGITVVNGKVYDSQFEKIKSINEKSGLMKAVNARGEACNSDHCFFHKKGVPSFFIYTLGGTKYYHDVYDKADTLPLNEYESYFKLLNSFIREIGEVEVRK